MSKRRQLMLEFDPSKPKQPLISDQLLTLDQLTEWDLQFTEEFSREMYTRVRENARSLYVLLREILPVFELLVEKGEWMEQEGLPEPYISRIHDRLRYFLRDVL